MPLTHEEAKNLKHGQILYEIGRYNSDGTPKRWRVTGRVKTWKRSPNRIQIPVRHGLYDHSYVYENTLEFVTLNEQEALNAKP